jgi:1-deoxyxylulose-5-phosphate synthase
VIPWSPLARGLLTGNRTRSGEKLTKRAQTDAFADSLYKPDIDFEVIERADAVAAERDLQDALAAEQLSLSAEEIERLTEPYTPHPVAGHS